MSSRIEAPAPRGRRAAGTPRAVPKTDTKRKPSQPLGGPSAAIARPSAAIHVFAAGS